MDSGPLKLKRNWNSNSALSAPGSSEVKGERIIMVEEMVVEGTNNMSKTNIMRIWGTERSHLIILCMLRRRATLPSVVLILTFL